MINCGGTYGSDILGGMRRGLGGCVQTLPGITVGTTLGGALMHCVGVRTTLVSDTRRGGFGIITGDASGCCYCSFWLMIDVTGGAGMRTCYVVAS